MPTEMLETVRRVVVVDDEADIRLLLEVTLGHDPRFDVVAIASDGTEALEAARRHQPDVVVVDWSMPDHDPRVFIGRLRAASPSTRVVVFSAHDVEREAMELGAVGYMRKPLREVPGELLRVLGEDNCRVEALV